jgi:predicted Zn-dependent protease
MKILKVYFIVAMALIFDSCATSPAGRSQLILLPDSQVDAMGVEAFQALKTKQPVENDPQINTYVKCVAQAIASASGLNRPWETTVFKDETANAFALPGGKIGVHTGLLKVAQTPGQLAAVLGHEVGHVIARHGNERMSESFATQGGLSIISAILNEKSGSQYNLLMSGLGLGVEYGLTLPHSRTQESEADDIGLELMAKAGFDPREAIRLWENMEHAGGGNVPEFLSTHPSHGTRITDLRSRMNSAVTTFNSSQTRPTCHR